MRQVLQKYFRCTWTSIAALAAAALLVASAGIATAQERSRLDEVLQRGTLIVVTLGTVPPFAFKDEKGELVGFDIDVARLAANALFRDPSKIEFVIVTSDGRWPAIESGRADMGVGGTTVYPDRAIRVAFTRAFIELGHLDHGCQVLRDQITRGSESGEVHGRQSEQSADGGSGGSDLPEGQDHHLRYTVR